MLHPTALFALSLVQCQGRLQISRVKNIYNVFELSGVAFLLAPHYGGLLVLHRLNSIYHYICQYCPTDVRAEF